MATTLPMERIALLNSTASLSSSPLLSSTFFIKPSHYRCFSSLGFNTLHLHVHSASKSSRRLFLATTTSLWDAVTSLMGQNSAREAALAVRRGMQLFVQGDVEQSVVEFDKAAELDPRQKAYAVVKINCNNRATYESLFCSLFLRFYLTTSCGNPPLAYLGRYPLGYK